MKNVEKLLKNLVVSGDIVGVACSGGSDSMCLLNYLNSVKEEYGINVVAITVDHSIRENSSKDADFVENYCTMNNIKCLRFKVDALKLSEQKNISVELAARELRYKVFNALIKKGEVTKIALGHHLQDQAETILLNILRGAGVTGAGGMSAIRDGVYIRPLLKTSKQEIMVYNNTNEIPFVEDETNADSDYSRNYLRNMVMPLIRTKWMNADLTISNFGEHCREDEEFINSLIPENCIISENNGTVRIKTSVFDEHKSLVARILRKAFKMINASTDIEKKHFAIITGLAKEGENGSKVNLPNKIIAIKEYSYITLTNKIYSQNYWVEKVKRGVLNVPDFGIVDMNLTRKLELGKYNHLIDYNKVPKDAVWRFRRDGDMFEKFGSGRKSLSDYLIDRKIPARQRNIIPVLASGNEILVIGGVEISNLVRIDQTTVSAWGINVVKF